MEKRNLILAHNNCVSALASAKTRLDPIFKKYIGKQILTKQGNFAKKIGKEISPILQDVSMQHGGINIQFEIRDYFLIIHAKEAFYEYSIIPYEVKDLKLMKILDVSEFLRPITEEKYKEIEEKINKLNQEIKKIEDEISELKSRYPIFYHVGL